MQYAPLFLLFFGYWCMGNMQIFNDTLVPLANTSMPLTTDHYVYPEMNQALPLFIVGCLVTGGLIFTDLFKLCLSKMHLYEEYEEFTVDEKVGSYFECVSVPERKLWVAEELHLKKDLGINTIGKQAFEKLRVAKGEWRVIKNAPNYEVLTNPVYQQAFQYTPIDRRDTEQEKVCSEAVQQVMYLGYIKKDRAELDFTKANIIREIQGRRNSTAANDASPAWKAPV